MTSAKGSPILWRSFKIECSFTWRGQCHLLTNHQTLRRGGWPRRTGPGLHGCEIPFRTRAESRKHFRIFYIVWTPLSFSKVFVSYLLNNVLTTWNWWAGDGRRGRQDEDFSQPCAQGFSVRSWERSIKPWVRGWSFFPSRFHQGSEFPLALRIICYKIPVSPDERRYNGQRIFDIIFEFSTTRTFYFLSRYYTFCDLY